MVEKKFCDRCNIEIEESKDKGVFDNGFYMRFGSREVDTIDLCDTCVCEMEILIRSFLSKKDIKNEYRSEIKKLIKEIHQWKETCEILADPKLMKSIKKSLMEFAEGKGIPLNKLTYKTREVNKNDK